MDGSGRGRRAALFGAVFLVDRSSGGRRGPREAARGGRPRRKVEERKTRSGASSSGRFGSPGSLRAGDGRSRRTDRPLHPRLSPGTNRRPADRVIADHLPDRSEPGFGTIEGGSGGPGTATGGPWGRRNA